MKITEHDARYEFDILRSEDKMFDTQWGCNDLKQQEKNFYEWCSNYEDLRHITKRIN
tara:strand:- start:58 stop:228 length:171 start_codon:yes stop_codon:yes gene_type:complete